jgi:hypothetical protein
VASAATASASPTATRGIDILSALGGLNVSDFARGGFARRGFAGRGFIEEFLVRGLT